MFMVGGSGASITESESVVAVCTRLAGSCRAGMPQSKYLHGVEGALYMFMGNYVYFAVVR